MHAMNSGGSRDLRGVWRDLLPAGYCPVSCPRIFCLIMSVQRFRLGFDIVIFSSDWNLQHNIRGTKLLHLSQTEYPPCFINGMNFVSKWGSWDIYVVWSVPSLARWRIFPKSFVFQILNMIDTTLLGPSAGLETWRERLFTLDQSQLRSREVSTNQAAWQSREPWYKPCDMEYNNIITSLLIPLLPLKHRMERQQEEMSSISKVWTI